MTDAMDRLGPIRRQVDEAKKQADMQQFLVDVLPKHMQNLETLAKAYSNDGPFFVGARKCSSDRRQCSQSLFLVTTQSSRGRETTEHCRLSSESIEDTILEH
jgi:hypothetical protein